MQQILAGKNVLNERVQNAEVRATEGERQAQETQQKLVRSHAGVNGKVKGAAVPLLQEQGIGAFASKYQVQPYEGEDEKWREWARVWTIFCGALEEIHENVEGHRNDSATILSSLRFLRGVASQHFHRAVSCADYVEHSATIQRVDGLARTTKPQASPARTKANKIKARAKVRQRREQEQRKG